MSASDNSMTAFAASSGRRQPTSAPSGRPVIVDWALRMVIVSTDPEAPPGSVTSLYNEMIRAGLTAYERLRVLGASRACVDRLREA